MVSPAFVHGHLAQISNISTDFLTNLLNQLVGIGIKIVAAIVLFFIGRRLISFALSLISQSFKGKRVDATIISYFMSSTSILLNIVLIAAILGIFGIETTSFAALLAAAGVAIGAAWGGLLANFAAGAFLVIFRPFSVGDFITAGGVTGTVQEIGMFVTTITTPDNIVTIVGNNKIFADNIQNYSSTPHRRVDLVAQLAHGVNISEAMDRLYEYVSRVPNVMTYPSPEIAVLELTNMGPKLMVRPYCSNNNYWQVYCDTNKAIAECFRDANYPTPEQAIVTRAA